MMLYSLSSLPVSHSESFDDSVCQGIINVYPSAKLCVAVAYRPPDATADSFKKLLDSFTRIIEDCTPSDYDLFVSGDFNLPQIDWESHQIQSGASADSNLSAQRLLQFMSTHLLGQMVTTPTRGNNILDLILCNNNRLICDVTCEATEISDHMMVNAQRHILGAVKKSKLCGTAPDYKGKMCGKVR